MPERSLFKPHHNCWRADQASHASLLIDCANYYEALHAAICRARHSIFVIGWDIDSRIELLRGRKVSGDCPTSFFDLIEWKAYSTPELKIYLNRWDYSLYLAAEREGLSKMRWYMNSPMNVHYCLDGVLPVGASHHQKVVVIDDEVAFSGGMDVALGRWDGRHHYPENKHRVDPGGAYQPGTCQAFDPYHDIQMLVAGPIARHLSELVRERWRLATGYEAIPIREQSAQQGLPQAWPKEVKIHFQNVRVAIALTVPPIYGKPAVTHAKQLYLDMIATAEKFIYMENQFFTEQDIAKALNARLTAVPGLRVMLIGCYDPKGIMERKALWHGRVLFRDLLEADNVKHRVVFAYPISALNGTEKPVRIHSKLMIIDNRYLRVASSNINNRSMGVDTECDLVIEGEDDETRSRIAAIRNDLIREHTGREIADIEKLIEKGAPVNVFLSDVVHSRQHLRSINDESYRSEAFAKLATAIADPETPIIPGDLTMPFRYSGMKQSLFMRLFYLFLTVMFISGVIWMWKLSPLAAYTSPDTLLETLKTIEQRWWGAPMMLVLFALSGTLFFPLMALAVVTPMIFPPFAAFAISMAGAVFSAAIGFLLGRFFGMRFLRALLGLYAEKVKHYAKKGGMMSVTLLRLLPIAPFAAVNMVLGMSQITFVSYVTGTVLGLLPGITAFSFLGHSLIALWQNPNARTITCTLFGIAAWIALLIGAHFLGRYLHSRKTQC